jgi:hypothetical protein
MTSKVLTNTSCDGAAGGRGHWCGWGVQHAAHAGSRNPTGHRGVSQWRSGDVGRDPPDFRKSQRYGPAVVNISVVSSGKASADDVAQAGPDDETTLPLKTRSRVRRFQPGQAKGAVRVGAHRPEQITRIGSGFIVSPTALF